MWVVLHVRLVSCLLPCRASMVTFPQVWRLYPRLRGAPEDAFLPTFSRQADGWCPFSEKGFYNTMAALMCAVTRRHSSLVGKFRHVLQTRLGKGSLGASSRMGALLGHGPDTAIRFYDNSRRRFERMHAFHTVVDFLAPPNRRRQTPVERAVGEECEAVNVMGCRYNENVNPLSRPSSNHGDTGVGGPRRSA